jgi:hypothetical protein
MKKQKRRVPESSSPIDAGAVKYELVLELLPIAENHADSDAVKNVASESVVDDLGYVPGNRRRLPARHDHLSNTFEIVSGHTAVDSSIIASTKNFEIF